LTAARGQRRGSVVLVTRPGEAGQRLTGALRGRSQRALWWPAFDLLPPTQVEPLQAQLQRLPEFDLVVFISAAAVRGLARLQVCTKWPAATRIAAVGASTLQLAHSLLPGLPSEAQSAKEGRAEAGSEGLWQALQKEPERPRKVMIVRAEAGREWLGDRLREAGSHVEYAAVYRREVHTPSAEQRGALAASCSVGDHAAVVLTSSEAVATLDRQLAEAPEIKAWLRRGRALCSHPRIVQAALSAGYSEARECEPAASSVLDAIDAAARGEAAPARAEARAP
jgi:uroporphyrinogen III methyltransferase/synthase